MKKLPRAFLWRYIPGLAISLFVVLFLSRFIKIENLVNSLRTFSFLDIVILGLIMLLSLIARGFVWKSLLDRLSFKDAFFIINEGYLFNNLIPRSGEVARIFITSHISSNNIFQATAAIVFERTLDLLIAAGMFLSTVSLVLELRWLKGTAIWILIIFSFVLLLLIAVAMNSKRIATELDSIKLKNEFIKNKVKPLILRSLQGLSLISQPKKIFSAVFWICISWIFWVMLLYYAILKISPSAPLLWAIFTEGIIALGIALPSAPANLGVYEGTLVFALSIFGIKNDVALGAAIVLHIIQIATTIILGLAGLFFHDFKIGQIIEKIQRKISIKNKNSAGNQV